MIIEGTDYLEHYGVKGMKWGVRKDRDNSGSSTKMSDIPKHKSTKSGEAGSPVILGIYGGLLATAVVSKAVMNFKDSGRKDAKKTGDKEFKKNPELAKKMSVDQLAKKVVKPINPGYGEKGTQMNCRRATMAYEMRRRGNDVKATKSKYASGQSYKGMKKAVDAQKGDNLWGENPVSFPKDMKFGDSKTKSDTVFKALSTQPNGSRGEVGVGWLFGGGHSMAYEVVNRKPVIFDTQSGDIYKGPRDFDKFSATMMDAAFTRLDNKPINQEFIKRWVTDV